ncbi:hypothetical protein NLI96_g6272 [Meripilus lineatus]|uniref:Uncharacterized protein n=1 Tax=Meripilus lineatus TaxID=2056292 RepID=A0AAD5YG35_9APHY|nr:hypothetical protein NLI96_g6272 [Physisporinus lineatus]
MERVPLVPELNHDVVHYIMTSCPRSNVSSLMKTCRMYYSIGVPILLRRCDELHKGSESFYAFMFATSPGPPDRFRYLLDLKTSFDPNKPETLMVPHLLLRATNIERLELWGRRGVDELMKSYPHVVDSLTNLIEFRCGVSDGGVLEWLERTTAPIARLDLMFSLEVEDNTSPVVDVLPSILKFAETLVSLELDNAIIGPCTSGIQFRKVRKIKIRMDYLFGYLTTGPSIIQSFPNLESFYFFMLDIDEDELPGDEEKIHREHRFNVAEVSRLGDFPQSLKDLEGHIVALYRGGFLPENVLDKFTIHEIRHEDISRREYLPVFERISPRALSLRLCGLYQDQDIKEFLELALQDISTAGILEELELIFYFEIDMEYVPESDTSTGVPISVAEAFLCELTSPLELVSVTVERLTVRCTTDWIEAQIGLVGINASAVADLYFEAMPSLESFTLCTPRLKEQTGKEEPKLDGDNEIVYTRPGLTRS